MVSQKTLQFNKKVFTKTCPDQNISVTAVHDEGNWRCCLYYYRRANEYLVRIVITTPILDQLVYRRGITSTNELVDEVMKYRNNVIRLAIYSALQFHCGCLEECFCDSESQIRQHLCNYNAFIFLATILPIEHVRVHDCANV